MSGHSNGHCSAAGEGLKRGVSCRIGCLALALALAGGSTRADLFDAQTVTNNTGTSQSRMNLVFDGNVTSAIDATVNPFGAGGSHSIHYDSASNSTTVMFSGAAIAAGAAATYGLSFNNNGFKILDSFWNTLANAFPSLSVTASSMSQTGTTYYGLFFTELAFKNAPTEEADIYEELPIPGGCGQFDMTNDNHDFSDFSADTVTTFDSAVGGAWITWPIPLNKLDPTDTPPTEPLFWPVTSPAEVAEATSFEEDVYVTPCPKPSAAGAALTAILIGISAWTKKG